MDKTLSLTFGRSACIPDYDIDVELPKKSDEICWSLFVAWISLAKIQSRTYERLYSATANASGPDERRAAVVELDGQLRRWSADNSKLKADWPPNIMEEKYVEVELRFTYHLSLLLIHRVDHGSGTQSEDICLDSARNAIGAIQMTVAEDSDLAESGLLLWSADPFPVLSSTFRLVVVVWANGDASGYISTTPLLLSSPSLRISCAIRRVRRRRATSS